MTYKNIKREFENERDGTKMIAELSENEKFLDLLLNFYKGFLEGSSRAVGILADIERDFPQEYKSIKEFGEDPRAIERLIEGLPSEKQSILLKLLLRSGKFAKDFINLMNLTEKQKRELSQDLSSFSMEINKEIKK